MPRRQHKQFPMRSAFSFIAKVAFDIPGKLAASVAPKQMILTPSCSEAALDGRLIAGCSADMDLGVVKLGRLIFHYSTRACSCSRRDRDVTLAWPACSTAINGAPSRTQVSYYLRDVRSCDDMTRNFLSRTHDSTYLHRDALYL